MPLKLDEQAHRVQHDRTRRGQRWAQQSVDALLTQTGIPVEWFRTREQIVAPAFGRAEKRSRRLGASPTPRSGAGTVCVHADER